MSTIKALIVDDDDLARVQLEIMLEAFPKLEIIGQADSAETARKLIDEYDPALIFLDVEMPIESGFDLIHSIKNPPAVILTTSHKKYAIQAFEVPVMDYLMKPISRDRLKQAVDKFFNNVVLDASPKPDRFNHLYICDGDKSWIVKFDDIRLVLSEEHFIRPYFNNESPLIHRSLTQIEEKLPKQKFFKSSRSSIVNIDWIHEIKTSSGGKIVLVLKDGMEVTMSRRATKEFKAFVGL
jgi:two-component system LytT family response regulator